MNMLIYQHVCPIKKSMQAHALLIQRYMTLETCFLFFTSSHGMVTSFCLSACSMYSTFTSTDVHISSISSLLQLRNLSQDGDTTNPHIWLTSDSQFMASVSQNWSDPQAGTVQAIHASYIHMLRNEDIRSLVL